MKFVWLAAAAAFVLAAGGGSAAPAKPAERPARAQAAAMAKSGRAAATAEQATGARGPRDCGATVGGGPVAAGLSKASPNSTKIPAPLRLP